MQNDYIKNLLIRDILRRLEALETYVFETEPNILPDSQAVGRGLEEYTVGISGTDETI